jgi:hypothetical protein
MGAAPAGMLERGDWGEGDSPPPGSDGNPIPAPLAA